MLAVWLHGRLGGAVDWRGERDDDWHRKFTMGTGAGDLTWVILCSESVLDVQAEGMVGDERLELPTSSV